MRRSVFVAQVLALLAGFYVLCAALVAALVALTYLGFDLLGTNKLTVVLLLVTLAAIFVVIRGVFVSTHVKAREIAGIRVPPPNSPCCGHASGNSRHRSAPAHRAGSTWFPR
jgi:hypothetical protein